MCELDFTKTMDFEVIGDIKPIIKDILGHYQTYMTSDCALHLKGTMIDLPAYCPYLTYYSGFLKDREVEIKIISALYEKGIIKIHEIRD